MIDDDSIVFINDDELSATTSDASECVCRPLEGTATSFQLKEVATKNFLYSSISIQSRDPFSRDRYTIYGPRTGALSHGPQ